MTEGNTAELAAAAVTCRRCRRPYRLPPAAVAAPGRTRGLLACPHCGASPQPLAASLRGNHTAATLAFFALVLLVPGMLLPFIKTSQLGTETSYSLIASIAKMLHTDPFLGVVLLVFSVLFPLAKLLMVLAATSSLVPMPTRLRHRLHAIAAATGKYSLLDVLVVALLIVAIKIKGIARVAASSGTVVFCLAILLSILAGLFVSFTHLEDDHE